MPRTCVWYCQNNGAKATRPAGRIASDALSRSPPATYLTLTLVSSCFPSPRKSVCSISWGFVIGADVDMFSWSNESFGPANMCSCILHACFTRVHVHTPSFVRMHMHASESTAFLMQEAHFIRFLSRPSYSDNHIRTRHAIADVVGCTANKADVFDLYGSDFL